MCPCCIAQSNGVNHVHRKYTSSFYSITRHCKLKLAHIFCGLTANVVIYHLDILQINVKVNGFNPGVWVV